MEQTQLTLTFETPLALYDHNPEKTITSQDIAWARFVQTRDAIHNTFFKSSHGMGRGLHEVTTVTYNGPEYSMTVNIAQANSVTTMRFTDNSVVIEGTKKKDVKYYANSVINSVLPLTMTINCEEVAIASNDSEFAAAMIANAEAGVYSFRGGPRQLTRVAAPLQPKVYVQRPAVA